MFVLLLLLKILLYILLTIITLVVLILVLPFTYNAEVLVIDGINARYNFGWPGKLVQIKGQYMDDTMDMAIYIAGRRIMRLNRRQELKLKKAEKEVKEEVKAEVKEKAKRSFDFRDLLDKSLIEEVLAYIKRILRILKPDVMSLSGTYGFEDPALTGMTYGVICVIRGSLPKAKLDFHPCFTDAVLELDLKTAGDVVAAPILYQTLRTVLKKPIRKKIFKRRK